MHCKSAGLETRIKPTGGNSTYSLPLGNNPFSLGYPHEQGKQLFSHYQLVVVTKLR